MILLLFVFLGLLIVPADSVMLPLEYRLICQHEAEPFSFTVSIFENDAQGKLLRKQSGEATAQYAGNITGMVAGDPKSSYNIGFKVEHTCAGMSNTLEDVIPSVNCSLPSSRCIFPLSIFILQYNKD